MRLWYNFYVQSFPCSSTVERLSVKEDVAGSNPAGGASIFSLKLYPYNSLPHMGLELLI